MDRTASARRRGRMSVTIVVIGTVVVLATGCVTPSWGGWAVADPPSRGARPFGLAPISGGMDPLIACGGPAFCLAVGSPGAGAHGAARWDGTAWTVAPDPPVREPAYLQCAADLSAPTAARADWCVLFGTDATAIWDGGWTPVGPTPPLLRYANFVTPVSCPTAGVCFVGGGNQLERWDTRATTVVAAIPDVPDDPAYGPPAIALLSCRSATSCTMVARAEHERLWRWHDGDLTALPTEVPDVQIGDLDCPRDDHCVAVGRVMGPADAITDLAVATWSAGGVTVTYPERDGARVGADVIGNLGNVDCPSTSTCLATGGDHTAVLEGGAWRVVSRRMRSAVSFACATAGVCFGVTERLYAPGPPDAPDALAGAPGPVAFDIVRWDGAWSPTGPPVGAASAPFAEITDVSCALDQSCLAVGSYVDGRRLKLMASRYDGRTWVPLPDIPLGAEDRPKGDVQVDCARADACAVTLNLNASGLGGNDNRLVTWNGTAWTATPVRPADSTGRPYLFEDVSCGGPSSCLAVGTIGAGTLTMGSFAFAWNGTSWSPVPAPPPIASVLASSRRNRLSCSSATSCLQFASVGARPLFGPDQRARYNNSFQAWNGTAWSPVPNPFTGTPGDDVAAATDVDCLVPFLGCTVSARPVVVPSGTNPARAGLLAATWGGGAAWTKATLPAPAGVTVAGDQQHLACALVNACVVTAGTISGPGLAVWGSSGSTWTVLAPPAHPSGPYNEVLAAACTPTFCVLAGRHTSGATRVPVAFKVDPRAPGTPPAP